MLNTQSELLNSQSPVISEGNSKPTEVFTIPRLTLDCGNRFTAGMLGDRLIQFPSYAVEPGVKQYFDFDKPHFKDGQSFVIEYGSIRYSVGQKARLLCGDRAYDVGKWNLAKPFFLAALSALTDAANIYIEELVAAVPDPSDDEQVRNFRALAEGLGQSYRANGVDRAVKVGSVRIEHECHYAYAKAVQDGLLIWPGMSNGVIDLGGGTSIYRLIDSDGDIDDARSGVINGGTAELASDIAEQCFADRDRANLVMDAISDGSFEVRGDNFKHVYDELFPKWIQKIHRKIQGKWNPVISQIAQILIIGGSAPLVREYFNVGEPDARFVMPSNPQHYGLEGLNEI